MPGKNSRLVWLALPLAYLLYFFNLSASGLLGPDEPRYASVAREMARSGDWITPRLWGQPWFEKPALLYWMTATGFRLGLGTELAPRLPVALLAVAFLGLFWWALREEFGIRVAWASTLILGTSAGFVAYSQIGVPDLPMTAAFSAAMLLALPWIARGDARRLPWVSALLGLAVLAKGLPPLVLALPLVMRGRRWRDWLRWRTILPFFLVALPWYWLCYLHNGRTFLDVFFWQHHFSRFVSSELQHGQPWWFYVPVLLGGLLPWTPLLAVSAPRAAWKDPRRLFLLLWVLFGLLFFSLSANKLPGYVLPLLPPIAVLIGLTFEECAASRPLLAVSALLMLAYPVARPLLPAAVAAGLSRAPHSQFDWAWLPPVLAAVAVCLVPWRGRRLVLLSGLAVCATLGIAYLKIAALPEVNRLASARGLWNEIGDRARDVCVDGLNRNWVYGLNYYSTAPLPDCSAGPKPLAIRQSPGEPPRLAPGALVDRSNAQAPFVPTKNENE